MLSPRKLSMVQNLQTTFKEPPAGPLQSTKPILPITTRRVVSHWGLAIYILKKVILKAKEELWKFKYFIMQKSVLKTFL